MKAFNTFLKILTAIAAVAGAIYIVATYGEQIVAWAKRMLAAMPKCPCSSAVVYDATAADEAPAETPVESPVEPQAEQTPEEPAPEVVVSDHEPVAEEADFAE